MPRLNCRITLACAAPFGRSKQTYSWGLSLLGSALWLQMLWLFSTAGPQNAAVQGQKYGGSAQIRSEGPEGPMKWGKCTSSAHVNKSHLPFIYHFLSHEQCFGAAPGIFPLCSGKLRMEKWELSKKFKNEMRSHLTVDELCFLPPAGKTSRRVKSAFLFIWLFGLIKV